MTCGTVDSGGAAAVTDNSQGSKIQASWSRATHCQVADWSLPSSNSAHRGDLARCLALQRHAFAPGPHDGPNSSWGGTSPLPGNALPLRGPQPVAVDPHPALALHVSAHILTVPRVIPPLSPHFQWVPRPAPCMQCNARPSQWPLTHALLPDRSILRRIVPLWELAAAARRLEASGWLGPPPF